MASSKKKVVRRIKADDKSGKSTTTKAASNSTVIKPAAKAEVKPTTKTTKKAPVESKEAKKNKDELKAQKKVAKANRKPFILLRPLFAIGRYIRDSWRELMKVQWPTRRATWKMTLGVIIFCVIVGIFVLICDWASQWLMKEVIL